MNLDLLMTYVLQILPNATVDERDGEVVIFTGLEVIDSENNLGRIGDFDE